MVTKKKSPEELRTNKYLNRACNEINGFSELLQRFERNISILGRSKRTFENYSRHVAALALHFGALPTDLHPEQVKDYLFELQQRSHSPSQSYFKHTVYGLRFLLKTENLPYDYLHLPSIPKEKKLPVILSREEIWRMLQHADLLFKKNWVVYAKRPFGGPKQVIEYLGRYTHKVAISNHRIKNVTEQEVTISYKDYKDGSKTKQLTLKNEEFTRRFSLHILPKRFVRIRHYGILSSSWKRGKLQQLQKDLKVVRPIIEPKTQHKKCYCCKVGNLITLHVFGQRGPPKAYLIGSKLAPVN